MDVATFKIHRVIIKTDPVCFKRVFWALVQNSKIVPLKDVSELSSAGDRPAICRSGREVKHVHMKEHASESRKWIVNESSYNWLTSREWIVAK